MSWVAGSTGFASSGRPRNGTPAVREHWRCWSFPFMAQIKLANNVTSKYLNLRGLVIVSFYRNDNARFVFKVSCYQTLPHWLCPWFGANYVTEADVRCLSWTIISTPNKQTPLKGINTIRESHLSAAWWNSQIILDIRLKLQILSIRVQKRKACHYLTRVGRNLVVTLNVIQPRLRWADGIVLPRTHDSCYNTRPLC